MKRTHAPTPPSETPLAAQSHYRAYREFLDSHPVPEPIELATRSTMWSRPEAVAEIVRGLHSRFADERATGVLRGDDPEPELYAPHTLEQIAAPDSEPAVLNEVFKDVTTLGIELLGLLWRLEDAGVIERCESIVDSANSLGGAVSTAEAPRCACEWADEPWHDQILTIESAGPHWALDLTACMVRAVEGGVANNEEGIAPNDFEQFVTEHNWQDPAAMSHLASNLQFLFTAVLGVGR